ncbi:MAG: DEAD/DEAH box helicase family protein [Edaphocola sp.]
MKQLRQYQTDGIDAIARKYAEGLDRLIFQLATGGGKTVTFAALANRFGKAMPKKNILIAVHREELLRQARTTLYEWYGMMSEPITAGARWRNPNVRIYVTMVETANNRLKKNPKFFGDVGLFVIDEAHLGNFTKLHGYFPGALIVGFTATPISGSKKNPLNGLYKDIVCGIDIPDLVAQGSLVPNRTYHVKNAVARESLRVKNGEFDTAQMAATFSSGKHIKNCVEAYAKHVGGTKAIVFNCNVEHSRLVAAAFVGAGYDSRHLDGNAPENERRDTLKWFHETPGAILNNIGILTTGFDEPTVETVIVNRGTKSLPLWLQMTGRGSRPAPGKDKFTILDLGGNALSLGDWCDQRDWAHIFHNPGKPGKPGNGAAPVKSCDSCEAIMPATAKVCPVCGHVHAQETQYDSETIELELLKGAIDMAGAVEATKKRGYNDYYALHVAKQKIAALVKPPVTDEAAYSALAVYQEKVAEWCRQVGKAYNQWHKENTAAWFFEELERAHQWRPKTLEIST